jgi:hypothetical protein
MLSTGTRFYLDIMELQFPGKEFGLPQISQDA